MPSCLICRGGTYVSGWSILVQTNSPTFERVLTFLTGAGASDTTHARRSQISQLKDRSDGRVHAQSFIPSGRRFNSSRVAFLPLIHSAAPNMGSSTSRVGTKMSFWKNSTCRG